MKSILKSSITAIFYTDKSNYMPAKSINIEWWKRNIGERIKLWLDEYPNGKVEFIEK